MKREPITPEIGTMEKRIREKAQSELASELTRAFLPIRKLVAEHAKPMPLVHYHDRSGARTTVTGALDEIQSAMFAALRDNREDNAVRAFPQRLDDLQTQLDELRARMHVEDEE